jgi:hypothetical protein
MLFAPGFLMGFVVFCVVLLCVFTYLVPCCDVRYDFHIKTMFGSSLPHLIVAGIMAYLCLLRIVLSNMY